MSLFNERIDRVQSQLTSLSTGRKIFWGCLLALVLAVGLWWGRADRQVAFEPVLDQTLEPAQLAQITTYLSSKQVPFKTEQNKVLVPADRKIQVLADLFYEDLLPSDTQPGFDAIARTSIWDSSSKVERMYIEEKQATLSSIIGRFPSVKKATVLIDPTSEQHINGSVTPSALVDIQTRGGVKNSRQLATAAVNAVIGAQSNLPRDKVQVTIDGAPVRTTIDPNELASEEQIERVQQREQFYVAKVRKQLSYIPDALVSVTVKLPMRNGPMGTRATGIVANVGVTLGGRRDGEQVTSASVAVPRSYFVRILQNANPNAIPSDGVLQPVIDLELEKIRKLVRTTLGIKSDDDVTVASYVDQQPPAPPTSTIQTASAPVSALLSNRVVQIAMGVTALMLLVVGPLVVRRGKPHGATVSSRPIHAALLSPRVGDLVDEEFADEGDFEASEGLGEIQSLAQDSPDATASLLAKWINQR